MNLLSRSNQNGRAQRDCQGGKKPAQPMPVDLLPPPAGSPFDVHPVKFRLGSSFVIPANWQAKRAELFLVLQIFTLRRVRILTSLHPQPAHAGTQRSPALYTPLHVYTERSPGLHKPSAVVLFYTPRTVHSHKTSVNPVRVDIRLSWDLYRP